MLSVRAIPENDLATVVVELGGSFLQMPAWGKVKADWRREYLGWFDADGELVGAGLVLYRSIPRTRRSFAYLADGPAVPWQQVAAEPDAWLTPLAEHVRSQGAFAVRVGCPMVARTWGPATVKTAIADGVLAFSSLPADQEDPDAERLAQAMSGSGWTRVGWDTAAAVGQPRFICVLDLTGRTGEDILRGMNQQWRRNIKKAARAGVEVVDAGAAGLADFHRLYVETAHRDGFVPRALSYFAGIEQHFAAEDSQATVRVYEARADGEVLASATMVTAGRTCSYLYGGSSSQNREARASNALQWQAIQDALADGCTAYDFRGFNTSLGATSPLTGLLQFKVGAGADVRELVGEHELVVDRFWHKAYELAMAVRVRINERRFSRASTPDEG